MARKPTKKAKVEAEDQQQDDTMQNEIVCISSRHLKQLLKDDDDYKGKIDGLAGELRETISNAAQKRNLHKKAYADLKKMHRMESNEKLAEYWHNLLAMMQMAGIMARIDSVLALPLEDDEAENAEELAEDEVEETGNVRTLGRRQSEGAPV